VFCRRRRSRRISSNEEPLEPIPMAVFNDEGDKCGAPVRKSEGVKYATASFISQLSH
jgi:hypothetical protein